MLVLSRKTDEAIVIGDSIRVTIISIHGGCVRLGIEAPHCVPILRHEVLLRSGDLEAESLVLSVE